MENFSSVTFQVKIPNFKNGLAWYIKLLDRKPNFIPHEGFAEWEIAPSAWLQVGEGTPEIGRPIRFGVEDIKKERERITNELNVKVSKIVLVPGVVLWCDFLDPFGNKLGFFQDLRPPLFTLLTPILYVKDLVAEKRFYLDLGFTLSYSGETLPSGEKFPGFLGLKYGQTIEFGLEQKNSFDVRKVSQQIVWQISANSLETIIKLCKKKGIKIFQQPKQIVKDWHLWEMKVKSPNGYEVAFEGPLD